MADLSAVFDAIDAALEQGANSAPAASPASDQTRPLTIRSGSSVKNTIDALDAALASKPDAAPKTIPGAAPIVPDTLSPGAAVPDRPATADQTIPDAQGAGAALDAVEGTGRANYDAGPAEDGMTPGERFRNLPNMGANAVAQAAEAVPLVGAGVNKAAAGLASLVNGRSVAENEATGQQVSDDFAAAHPGVTTASRLAGGIIGTAPLMAAAPEAFGLGGAPEGMKGLAAAQSFLGRGAAAVGSNAALSGADAAVRGEDVGKAAAVGGALGAIGPAAEGAAVMGSKIANAAGKTVGPIIAGIQLRGASPGEIDALMSNRRIAQAAADKVRSFSSEPATMDARVAAAPDAAVPGTPQTLSTAIGNDMGLFQAEKAARTVDNSAFNTVDAQRSTAALGALRDVQPAGDVFAPGKVLRQRLDAIDANADAAEARLTATHQEGVAGRASATQAFTDDQQGALAARQADRAQAQQADAVSATGDLAGRIADRTDAAAADKAAADAQRQAGLDTLAQGHAAQEAGLQQNAQDAAAGLGPVVAPEDAGAALRGSIEDARATAKQARSDLYKAIDPDGSLALVSQPVRQAAGDISKSIDPYAAPLSADATRLLGKARGLPDVMPFSSLTAFEQDITAAMAAERRSAGETNSLRLMTNLKGAVQDAISGAADNQAAHEAGLVSQGLLPADQTMEARIRDRWEMPEHGVADGYARATGNAPGQLPGSGASDAIGPGGTGGPAERGPGSATGNQGVSAAAGGGEGPSLNDPRFSAPAFDPDAGLFRAPPRPDVPRPQSLADFVRSKGGIQDTGGDLDAMGLPRLIAKPGAGLSPDAMREAAAEAGYLGADTARAMAETHPNDLFNALENGDRTYSVHDYDAVHAWDQHDQARAAYNQVRSGDPAARPAGPRPKSPVSAYGQDDIYAPGTAPEAANDGLRPNFDEAAADRLKAAKAGHAEYAQTYRNGPVAGVLKTNGFAGQYVVPDGAVMAKAFHPGDRGYEDVQAFLKAANNDPRAIQAIGDYALNGLRSKIGPAGTLSQKDVDRWAVAHAPAIRALQEAIPHFGDAVTTAAAADRTLVAAGLANKAEREAAQAQAAADALATDRARSETLKGQNAADRDNTGLALVQRREADKAADAADRAGVSSSIAERKAADAVENARSAAETSAGVREVRDTARAARATPAGQFARVAGDAVAPTEVANTVGAMLTTGKAGAAKMRGLVKSVENDPEALAGLRKAGIDFMMERLTNTDGALSDAKAIKFFLDNRDKLAELYPHDQRSMFGAIARDAARGKAYADATKVRGSDTAKNAIAFLKDKGPDIARHASLMTLAAEAVSQGFERGGVQGALMGISGAAGLYLVNGLRGAGVRGVADLTRAALSDAKVAQLLLSKAPTAAAPQKAYAIVGLLRRAAILGNAGIGAKPEPKRSTPIPSALAVPAPRRAGLLDEFVAR